MLSGLKMSSFNEAGAYGFFFIATFILQELFNTEVMSLQVEKFEELSTLFVFYGILLQNFCVVRYFM